MTDVILRDEFRDYWSPETAFDQVRKVKGEIAKAKDNRRVVRFELEGDIYYLKHHVGIGWKEVIKNFLQFKLPVLGASNEWYAIEKLKNTNINTMEAIAYGRHGCNPAMQESFLVTRELKNTITLEKLCADWKNKPPSYELKKNLIDQVAFIAQQMHRNGINHRDFYLCHILLDMQSGVDCIDPKKLRLYLVDLHRMQMRKKVPKRWVVKDIGSMYFSAMDAGLSRRDIYRFIRVYTGMPLKKALQERKEFWERVQRRANNLYQQQWQRKPDELFEG